MVTNTNIQIAYKPNQPLEPTTGMCCALELRRSFPRRGSPAGR